MNDARRINALSRAEYERQLAYLERLPAEGWTEQSACRDWQVYQVVSHIGSQPEIHAANIRAGLRGEPAQTNEQRQAIWGYFDSLKPLEVLPAFRKNNDAFFELIDSLSDDELGRTIPWFSGPTPMAGVLASRLNEQVLHTWDILWARDNQARLTPEAVPTLLQLNLTPFRLAGLVKPDQAPRLAGETVQFRLRDTGGAVHLRLAPNGVAAAQGEAESPALTAELPSEAFVRLLWGRYNVVAGLDSGELWLSDPSLADELQALLPGR